MKICQEVKNKEEWEEFLAGCEEKTFLQSWNWGEFQKSLGNEIWRLGIYNDDGSLASLALVVKVTAKRGRFLLIQHLPDTRYEIFKTFLDKLKEIAKEENCSFIRVASLLPRNKDNKKIFGNLGFRESPMHASAYEATLKLDLFPSEDELLMKMRKTTRYLIRRAEKNPDITIEKSDKPEDAEIYQKLNLKAARYQKFTPFSFEFVRNEFEFFTKDNQALLFFGKYRGEAVASALIIFWSGIGFYHQAAFDPKYHKIPIAYLLQWEAIKEAKKRGCRFYDFWGYVDPKSRHPWAGPTLFKMGFGGKVFEYVKTQDLPLLKRYWLTYIFEKLRKIKRGL